jgi:tetratricopeptide (TPR) repeat protein
VKLLNSGRRGITQHAQPRNNPVQSGVLSYPRSKFRLPSKIRHLRGQIGEAISNPQHSNPDEEELWNKAKNAEGAERADALVHLSYIAHSRKNYTESLALCESAKEIYESLGAEAGNAQLAHVYTGISYSLNELERNEEALEAGKHAIELLEEINSPDVLKAYRDEGSFAFDAKNYEDSIKWYTKALEYLSPDDNENNKAWDHFYIARALLKLQKNEEAIPYLKQARDMWKGEKNLRFMTYCDEELSLAYSRLGQIEFAKTHAELALDFAETAEDEIRHYWSKIRYATACLQGGEFQEAFDHFFEAKSWEVKESKYCFWPHVFALELKMADCVEGLGGLEDAIEVRRRIGALAESLGVEPEMP